MTITIDLPEEAIANLNERARAEGRPVTELATEAVTDRYGSFDEEEFPLDEDAVEKIRQSLAERDAGRTISLEDSRTRIGALLAARHGNGSGKPYPDSSARAGGELPF